MPAAGIADADMPVRAQDLEVLRGEDPVGQHQVVARASADRVVGRPAEQEIVAVEQIIKRLADGTIEEHKRTIKVSGGDAAGGSESGDDDEGSGEEPVQE